ncbi:MAG: DUF1294 domain-containing protein [Clostridium sp.]|nr:DUF1294 domain-containing protein [Clostridium sp.]MCI7443478.1 DUF1294 domain-containing protein [Clostridium sp.]
MTYIIIFYLLIINIIAFSLMYIDKQKAKKNKWRIKEDTLMISAFLGGSIGALIGMNTFRHKTKHAKFKYGIPAILIFQIIIGLAIYASL